jgi:type IV secretory pathway protease TraF
MLPVLTPGSIIFAVRKKPHIGHIVLAIVDGREVVKRIAAMSAEGVTLQGDNTLHSTDSRKYGSVSKKHIKAVVIFY